LELEGMKRETRRSPFLLSVNLEKTKVLFGKGKKNMKTEKLERGHMLLL